MVSLSYDAGALDAIIKDITTDTEAGARAGLQAVATQVPEILRDNIMQKGRGITGQWPDVSAYSMRNYRKQNDNPAEPLIDTGNLMGSGEPFWQNPYMVYVTLAPYGAGHDDGTGTTPLGLPVPKRQHMFIPESELTGLEEAFEQAYKGAA